MYVGQVTSVVTESGGYCEYIAPAAASYADNSITTFPFTNGDGFVRMVCVPNVMGNFDQMRVDSSSCVPDMFPLAIVFYAFFLFLAVMWASYSATTKLL